MKRTFQKVLAILMVLALCVGSFAACGGQDSGGNEGDQGTGKVTYLTMGTGGVAGTWYPVGGVICAAISKNPSLSATAQASAAGIENIRLASTDERQLGFCAPQFAIYAAQGVGAFEGTKIDNIRGIACMMPLYGQFVVHEKSDIYSIEDFVGHSVGTGSPGSGDEVCVRELLDVFGLSYDDIDEQMISYAEQVTAFKDGRLDVMFMWASAPSASVMDAASQAGCRVLSFTPEQLAKIQEKYPYYNAVTLPSSTYSFMKEDANMIGSPTLMFTTTAVSEDIIYDALTAMFDDIATIQASHATMADFSLETALNGLPEGVPLHDGAVKFYTEKGILK